MDQLPKTSEDNLNEIGKAFMQGLTLLVFCLFATSVGFALSGAIYVLINQMISVNETDGESMIIAGIGFFGGLNGGILYAMRLAVRRYSPLHARLGVGIICLMLVALWLMMTMRFAHFPHWLFHLLIGGWLLVMWWMSVADTFERFHAWRKLLIQHLIAGFIYVAIIGVIAIEHVLKTEAGVKDDVLSVLAPCVCAFGLMLAISGNIFMQRVLHAKWSTSGML